MAVKLSSLTALKDFFISENPRRAFITITQSAITLYSGTNAIAFCDVPSAFTAFKQLENFADLKTWREGDKALEWSGFLIPAYHNEEIVGASIKCRANFDGAKENLYEETPNSHFESNGKIKDQITTWLTANIPNVDIF